LVKPDAMPKDISKTVVVVSRASPSSMCSNT
jgi:hypothetical protein